MFRADRFARPARLLALGLAWLAGSGCGAVDPALINPALLPEHVKVLRVRIPDYDTASIQGIWMWRRSETTGQFEPLSEIRFGPSATEDGHEFVDYTLLDSEGAPVDVQLSAEVVRDGDIAELRLWFIRFSLPGEFKASLYNAAGESGLSSETLAL